MQGANMKIKHYTIAPNTSASPELASFHSSGACKSDEASACIAHHMHLTD